MTGRRDDDQRPTAHLLLQMLAQNDEKHEDAHKRLRESIRAVEGRIDELERLHLAADRRVTHLESTPPDATSLRFPLPLVFTIVIGFLALGGGMYSFRADVISRLDSAKNESLNDRRVQEVQFENLKETIKTLDQQQRLQYAEFQTFRQEMARRSR